jgi:Putative peptidoglycan binding domain
MKKLALIVLLIGLRTAGAQFLEQVFTYPNQDHFFHSPDSLAPRDDLGLLHQGHRVNHTDFAPRYGWRPLYWLEGEHDLIFQPAYMGALQRDLKRLGYYCGPIDGVFSPEVSAAIASMQKNYSMRVTGTLTVQVRRALFLP